MTESEVATTDASTRQTPVASVLAAAWAGWAVSVVVVPLATIAIEAVPHARGIAFPWSLRYALSAPACVLAAVGAASLYHLFSRRLSHPRRVFAASLFGLAVMVLIAMALIGGFALIIAGAPAVFVAAAIMAWLIPRFVERPRRSRVGTLATVVFGGLELFGVVMARASERTSPPGADGLAFDIPRALFDVDHRFIVLPSGARVHYVDEGKGPTLLFLHGNPSWSFQWRDLIKDLRGSYRCIAPDYPGFGLSDAPPGFGFTPPEESVVVEEFVDRLALSEVTLVMQDWGGPIGLGFAGRRPELVRSVILGSTWAWPTTTGEPRGKFSLLVGGPIGEMVQANFNGFAVLGIENGIMHALPQDVLDLYVRPFRPLARRGIAAFYPGQITDAQGYFEEVEAGLARISSKRALIFWALLDRGFPRSDLRRFEAAFPDHRTIELPNANHFFFEDAADRMVAEIRAFVDSDR